MDRLSQRITFIRNGQRAGLYTIEYTLPKNNFAFSTQKNSNYILIKSLELLRHEGYIRGFTITSSQKNIVYYIQFNVYLKYDTFGNKAINSISRVSTQGRRVYISAIALWQLQSTSGVFILSTSHGLITDTDARRFNIGGEVLFGVIL